MRLRLGTQWLEANLQVGWGWVPSNFLTPYLNSDMCSGKDQSFHEEHYIYDS